MSKKKPVEQKKVGRFEPDPKTLKYSKDDLAARDQAFKDQMNGRSNDGTFLREQQRLSVESTPKLQPNYPEDDYSFEEKILAAFWSDDIGEDRAFTQAITHRNTVKLPFDSSVAIKKIEADVKGEPERKKIVGYQVVQTTAIRKSTPS